MTQQMQFEADAAGPEDRRLHARVEVDAPCKVFDPLSRKYIAGSTWNLSSGGAMLEVHRPMDLKPGDKLHVGFALKRRQAVLGAAEMLPCEVVRALRSTTQFTAVAVRFVNQPAAVLPELKLHAA
jgi:hypothetical protein